MKKRKQNSNTISNAMISNKELSKKIYLVEKDFQNPRLNVCHTLNITNAPIHEIMKRTPAAIRARLWQLQRYYLPPYFQNIVNHIITNYIV